MSICHCKSSSEDSIDEYESRESDRLKSQDWNVFPEKWVKILPPQQNKIQFKAECPPRGLPQSPLQCYPFTIIGHKRDENLKVILNESLWSYEPKFDPKFTNLVDFPEIREYGWEMKCQCL